MPFLIAHVCKCMCQGVCECVLARASDLPQFLLDFLSSGLAINVAPAVRDMAAILTDLAPLLSNLEMGDEVSPSQNSQTFPTQMSHTGIVTNAHFFGESVCPLRRVGMRV